MGWFDEQLRMRKRNDERQFNESFLRLSSIITGRDGSGRADEEISLAKDAIEEILRFYHVAPTELPDNVGSVESVLEFELSPAGIMQRRVELKDSWYKDGMGAMLARTADGSYVALIPHGVGYSYFDRSAGKRLRVTRKNAGLFMLEATCFYKPLPLKSMSIRDLVVFMMQSLSISDYIFIGAATLAVTLIGMLMPYINNVIYSQVIPSGTTSLLVPVATLLLGVTVSSLLLNITKAVIMSRVNTKLSISVRAAAMARVISLPADFFRQFSSGELSSRVEMINALCSSLFGMMFTTGLSSVFSLVYITQIARYAPMLVVPSFVIIGVTLVFTVASSLIQFRITKQQIQKSAKLSGIVFALLSGIQKIKLSGAERRAFSKWADAYGDVAQLTYAPPMILRINPVISMLITTGGSIVIYYFAVLSGVSAAEYMAFNIAYGMVSGAILSLSSVALTFAGIKPMLDMVEPIFKREPETSVGKQMISSLSGSVDINNISFRYTEDMPPVLDDLSLKVRAGQYVAVVGKTGCGKSTLVRLLLGFERPQKGAIYYDGKNLEALDKKSLRQRIGVVMQDGKLFSGDIFSNIAIAAPSLTLEEAWDAAEKAGIADDIRDMPMGMHTLISEGSGGISGGQRQRLLIARAIAGKPRLLIFDEATSALDNITQKKVSESLDALKCTRIIIAHRLSTIRRCDRIIVLGDGHIIEDGGYDELLAKNGFFAELVARQQLDES